MGGIGRRSGRAGRRPFATGAGGVALLAGLAALAGGAGALLLVGRGAEADAIGKRLDREGREVVIAGQLFHARTPVVTWLDARGYDAYRPYCSDDSTRALPRRPAAGCDVPSRLSEGGRALVPEAKALYDEQGGSGPIDLAVLAEQVTQVVVHYDVAYTSAQCFKVLHDLRGLSCHFLLDLDGTLYQTCDLRERARHGGAANDRSIGIEIAHPGLLTGQPALAERYKRDRRGVYLELPSWVARGHLAEDFLARPARPEPIRGVIHGRELEQWDFTDAQYEALAHLLATLSKALPRVRLDAPRAEDGSVRADMLSAEELAAFEGIVGHYHITTNKQDPGPAFDWERVLKRARRLAR